VSAPAPNLFQQQAANRRRTTWLVIGFVLFFGWLGFGGDFILSRYTAGAEPGAYHHTGPWIGLLVTVVAAIMAAYAYRTGPEKVMWATGAREIDTPQTDEERQLANVVDEMAIAAGLPRPRVWIVPDPDPNAFATGRDPQHSHVAVTEGLLAKLNRDELQAVVAHEMGHIQNFDVRLMTTLAALVGAVLLIQDGVWRALRGGAYLGGRGRSGGGGGGKKSNAGPLLAIMLAVWAISWLLAPLITQLLAVSVSRKREYLADAMAAQFTRNPLALASALEKIENSHEPTRAIKRGAAHLCIADPLGRRLTNREGFLADAFATHPPMAMRIARLKGMGYAQLKRESGQTA
jgi:heat shock protein HtpX